MSEMSFKSKKLIILSSLIFCFLFLFRTVNSVAINNPDYTLEISPNDYAYIKFYSLDVSDQLNVEVEVIAGGNNLVDIYLVDSTNFQKYQNGLSFSAKVAHQGVSYVNFDYTITYLDDYYLIISNPATFICVKTVEIKTFIVEAEVVEEESIQINYPTYSTVFYIEEDDYCSCPIQWETTGDINYVTIKLYKGDNYIETIVSGTANDGYYDWWIYYSDGYKGSNYKIKIFDYFDDSVYDFSDYFEIKLEETRTIQVNYPYSGIYDVYENEGRSCYISWDYTGDIDYVTIELCRGTTYIETIAYPVTNDGSYDWTIYYSDGYDGSYRIKVSDYYDSSVYDFSNYFTIERHSFLERILPLVLTIGIPISIIVISIIIGVRHVRKKKREISPVKEDLIKSDIKVCPQCGSKVNGGEIFCGSCGKKL